SLRSPRTALVLGGGDGLAARELLRYGSLENIVLVDIDAEVTQLFRTEPRLARLNASALANPRLEIVNQDAWRWLDASPARFDAIVVDLPDPSNFALGKLYSTTFYRLLRQHLNDEGVIALQATSPLFARKAFWCIVQTLNRAGLETRPYHALVPTFGEWGFVIATKSAYRIPSTLPQGMRFLSKEQLSTMFVFSPDMAQVPVEENRLDNQILVQYYEQGWRHSVSRE
ncbi:MAG TPA: polyamine aminopropyltransferase, partial [Usitatibacter sp.]|nr:polyamine aminopropyltransferase [Usitatibacter sp.]